MRRLSMLVLAAFAITALVTACSHQQKSPLEPRESGLGSMSHSALGPGAAIGDFIWADANVNGVQDAGEDGVEGVVIEIYGPLGDDQQKPTTTQAVSDGKGFFQGFGLLPGEYRVTVTPPKGCELTKPFATKDPALDSNESGTTVKVGVEVDGSIDFGIVCKKDDEKKCEECKGRISQLTLRYTGSEKQVRVKVKRRHHDGTLFSGKVWNGGSFEVSGRGHRGGLSPEILIYVNGKLNARLRTDCSKPVGPGLEAGDFVVVSGKTRRGGELCPVDGDGDGDGSGDGL